MLEEPCFRTAVSQGILLQAFGRPWTRSHRNQTVDREWLCEADLRKWEGHYTIYPQVLGSCHWGLACLGPTCTWCPQTQLWYPEEPTGFCWVLHPQHQLSHWVVRKESKKPQTLMAACLLPFGKGGLNTDCTELRAFTSLSPFSCSTSPLTCQDSKLLRDQDYLPHPCSTYHMIAVGDYPRSFHSKTKIKMTPELLEKWQDFA